MKNKWHDFLKSFHNAFKILGYVITWGGFLLIVIGATKAQGFPNGFIGGLVMGSFFAFVSWLSFRNSYNSAREARESLLTDSQSQTIRGKAAIVTVIALAILVIFLLVKIIAG